jgi:hypothetical protein
MKTRHCGGRSDVAKKKILLNAFNMNCIGHINHGLWTHPRDTSTAFKTVEYWTELAQLLERGLFDGLFIADIVGVYDVYQQAQWRCRSKSRSNCRSTTHCCWCRPWQRSPAKPRFRPDGEPDLRSRRICSHVACRRWIT